MKKVKLALLLGLALMLVVTLVAACTAPTPTPIPTPTPTPSPSPTPAPTPAETVYEWRLQSVNPKGAVETNVAEDFAELVNQASDGRIEITVYGGGELMPIGETYEAIGTGMLEMHFNDPSWFSGKTNGVSGITSLPMVVTSYEQFRSLMWARGVEDIIRDVYKKDNVYLIQETYVASGNCFVNFPAHTLADFDGKKIRAYGLLSEWFSKMGITPVQMPPGEVYQALSTGVCDGVVSGSFVAMCERGFHEQAKYWIRPSTHATQSHFCINLDIWNELPEDLQGVLYAAASYAQEDCMSQFTYETDMWKVKWAEEWGGIESQVDEELLALMRQAAMEILDEGAAADPAYAEIVEIINAQMD